MNNYLINNKNTLAVTDLRQDALTILESGLRAVQTGPALASKMSRDNAILKIENKTYDLSKYHHIYVIGIGKAALAAATELERILGEHLTSGIVLDIVTGNLRRIKSLAGSHPHPSDQNIAATAQIIDLADQATANDLIITIISGGGSALLCQPYQLECNDAARITATLMDRGATIHELNTVRKHTSKVLGGQLAQHIRPAQVIGLIFSDVPGNDISMIASGPTILDTTTITDAQEILTKYDVLQVCSLENCNVIETPKDPHLFEHVENFTIVNNVQALTAMQATATDLGYKGMIYSDALMGDAEQVGHLLADLPHTGEAIIAGGETTVTVKKPGKGGRNLVVSLAALEKLPDDTIIISLASDGKDNVPVAGGIADHTTLSHAQKLQLDPRTHLDENRSYKFFEQTNALIHTGNTGINISDIMLAIRRP